MIGLIGYLIWLCWNLPTNKLFFAFFSTVEFCVELYVLSVWLIINKPWRKDNDQ